MNTTDKLAEALRLAHDHIEMDKLMVSHPRDWVLIKDALAQAEAQPAEPVGWTAGERAAFEADEARRELGSLLMSMAIIRELTKTQQCHADETVAAVRAMLAAAPAAPAPVPEADFGNISDLLPGTYYMDPPDGGSVTLREQFERMAKDAERYRWLRHGDNDEEVLRFHDWATEVCVDPPPMYLPRLERLDRLIDAARKEQTNG
ncbi:MAG: hypothetical protein ACK5PF_09955 [bacterium]